MKQMSVKKLCQLCLDEIEQGNGDKIIVISDDNEGNGFHGLFYGFTSATDFKDQIYDSSETDINKIIILG